VKVAVVLPAYNEAGNLTPLIAELTRVTDGWDGFRIVVVDDGSVDTTADELAELQTRLPALDVVRHPHNLGFAQAMKTGFATACRAGCDVVVCMDGDLSHRPADVPRLIAPLASGADVVLGSRFIAGGGMQGVAAWRAAISRAGNLFGRIVLGLPVTDLTSGYRAYRRHVLEQIHLEENSFAIQLEAIVKASAAGFTVIEVPIILGTRRHGTSHMNYSAALFLRYYRLLLACRRWLRDGRAAVAVRS